MKTRSKTQLCQLPDNEFLDVLPEEILYLLFTYISTNDIGRLAMTAKTMRDKVQTWIDSKACIYYLVPAVKKTEREKLELDLTACKKLAVLAKRTTFLYSTPVRVQLLNKWFWQLNSTLITGSPSDWRRINSILFFSSTLHSFSRGWDELEFPCIMQQLDTLYNVSRLLDTLLIEDNSLSNEEEADLRLVLHLFFWETSDLTVKGAWLNQLLRYKNISHQKQAVLLYLVLGPTIPSYTKDEWSNYSQFQLDVCRRLYSPPNWLLPQQETPSSFEEARVMFSDLGSSFQYLQSTTSTSDIIGILNYMFKVINPMSIVSPLIPFSWHTDNRAGLLLFTAEAIVVEYIQQELSLEKNDRVARLLVAMLVVCSRLENELAKSGLRKIVDWTMITVYPSEQFFVEFWQEVGIRFEMGDLESDMLIQLGSYISSKAYYVDPNNQTVEE